MDLLNKIRTPNRKVQLSTVLLHMVLIAVTADVVFAMFTGFVLLKK